MSAVNHDILGKVRLLQNHVQRGMVNPDSIDVRKVFLLLRDFFRDELLPDLTNQHAANDALELELGRLKSELETLKGKYDSKRRTANKQLERIAELSNELSLIRKGK